MKLFKLLIRKAMVLYYLSKVYKYLIDPKHWNAADLMHSGSCHYNYHIKFSICIKSAQHFLLVLADHLLKTTVHNQCSISNWTLRILVCVSDDYLCPVARNCSEQWRSLERWWSESLHTSPHHSLSIVLSQNPSHNESAHWVLRVTRVKLQGILQYSVFACWHKRRNIAMSITVTGIQDGIRKEVLVKHTPTLTVESVICVVSVYYTISSWQIGWVACR